MSGSIDPQGLPGSRPGETRAVEHASHLPVDRSLRDRRPVLFAVLVAVAGAVLTGIVVIGIGLSLTEGLLSGPLGRWDEGVNDWFLAHRTPTLDPVTHVGSLVAMTGSVIAVAAVVVLILAVMRRWRDAAFIVIALSVEVSVFLLATVLVQRDRPTVPQLEPSPPTSSYPSGHTGAALTLYVGLALLVTPHLRRTWMRVCVWIVAVAIPMYVAVSRIYEGMHHATDVAASVLVATGALVTATIAVRPPRSTGAREGAA
jgi:membrane-associated phospholipid phosphatase